MISDVATAFPLCPARFFGKCAMKSTVRDRICNPLRNLSANPPRALMCLRFSRLARKPENVLSDGFSEVPVPAPFRSQGILSQLGMRQDKDLDDATTPGCKVNGTATCVLPMCNTADRLLNTKESE